MVGTPVLLPSCVASSPRITLSVKAFDPTFTGSAADRDVVIVTAIQNMSAVLKAVMVAPLKIGALSRIGGQIRPRECPATLRSSPIGQSGHAGEVQFDWRRTPPRPDHG